MSIVPLAVRPEFSIRSVVCNPEDDRLSAPEPCDEHRLVLTRSGRFHRSADGSGGDLDATVGYLARPGEDEQFAHPSGGDVCTSITVDPDLWMAPTSLPSPVYADAAVDLAHRRLLAAAQQGDVGYAVTEELLGLIALTSGRARRRSDPAARRLVDSAREAILAGAREAASLPALAAHLGVSPYRLSRVFSAVLGTSLTRYRNRVRVGRAMERMAGGDVALADLAAELGFADQAHLTRTFHDHLGLTPRVLCRLLGASDPESGRDHGVLRTAADQHRPER